jgi:hypothetical protein
MQRSYFQNLPVEIAGEILKYHIRTKQASAKLVEKNTIITQHIEDVKKFVDAFPHLEGNIQFTQNITAFLVKRLRVYNMSAQKIVQQLSTSATKKEDMITWLTSKERAQQLAEAISNGDLKAVIACVTANPLLVHACSGEFDKTMLMKALKYPPLIKFLLQAGADPDIKNCYGLTALFICCNPIYQYDETTSLLLKGHANPNLPNAQGLTPLIEATTPKKVRTVELLLQHGANPNIRAEGAGYPWETALERAYYNIPIHEHNKDYEKAEALKEIVMLLKEHGALEKINEV